MKLVRFPSDASKPQYAILDDAGGRLATLEDLEKAGLILRYLNGSVITRTESEKALDIMHEIDEKNA